MCIIKHVALFLKENKPFIEEVKAYALEKFNKVTIFQGNTKDPLPQDAFDSFDCIISYLSPWIIPQKILSAVSVAAINFHPGPPEYPGIGCFNFALYDNVSQYGITCHHMREHVDTGKIIAVKNFAITPSETVYSLSIKSYAHMFTLYIQIVDMLAQNKHLPESNLQWKRHPFTRKELEDLCEIKPTMSFQEIDKRTRAVDFPHMPGAYFVGSDGKSYSICRDKYR